MRDMEVCPLCGRQMISDETRANLGKVNAILGEEELLCQLAEECAELAMAALKLRRVLNGKIKTTVTLDKAEANIVEEIADVVWVLTCLDVDVNEYNGIIGKKTKLWIKRLDINRK